MASGSVYGGRWTTAVTLTVQEGGMAAKEPEPLSAASE
jgi:hypothetical protein